ncbi:SMI1/KNR4 family protein [Kitasatospora sp. NPDC096140]|uniref:SMI1/KNR4 family protein n=1 Tax=Kitasatospora sp. NPDC096140 TaxID=3155425 RepID=UPI0033338257
MAGDALERLRQVLRPSVGSVEGAVLDLQGVAEAEAALGVRLPPDYLEFLAVYGAGTLDDFLVVAAPAEVPGRRLYGASIVEITGTFRRAAAKPRIAEVLGDGTSYVHWGMDDGGAYYLWRVEGRSSAEWPVCVYESGELTVLPYGIVEFLARACTGSLPEDLQRRFSGSGHEFLHWQDEFRRDTEQYGSGSFIGG